MRETRDETRDHPRKSVRADLSRKTFARKYACSRGRCDGASTVSELKIPFPQGSPGSSPGPGTLLNAEQLHSFVANAVRRCAAAVWESVREKSGRRSSVDRNTGMMFSARIFALIFPCSRKPRWAES